MSEYTPWYWNWWNEWGTKGRPPCKKLKRQKTGAIPPDEDHEWHAFSQIEYDKHGKKVLGRVEFWVACEGKCPNGGGCAYKEILVRLPSNHHYVTDVKCVCTGSKKPKHKPTKKTKTKAKASPTAPQKEG